MGARGLQILEYRKQKQCGETLISSFGLGLNVSTQCHCNHHFAAPSRGSIAAISHNRRSRTAAASSPTEFCAPTHWSNHTGRRSTIEAEIICEDVAKRYTRTFGAAHPLTGVARSRLACAQIQLTRQRAKAELASDFSRLSPEDQALFPGLATGFAAGISCPKTKKGFEEMMRAAQQGNPAAKAPSIKEMKATIRKAGFGVADLVEKSDVVKRYQEALARLGTA